MKRILITGASGFIGSYLVRHLQGFELQTLSLQDPQWQETSIDADVIIHCAGLAHASRQIDEQLYQEVNCELTKQLLEKAKSSKVSHLIFLSTALVYGEGHLGEISTSTPLNPQNAYAKSKVCAEVALQSDAALSTLILRLPLVIGDEPKGNLRSLARLSKVSPLFPKLTNLRSILRLTDLVRVINEAILHQTTGTLHPRSQQLSTSELYQQLRASSTLLIPFPPSVVIFLRNHSRFFAKLFGDFYYAEELL